jgi:hypothetical protein
MLSAIHRCRKNVFAELLPSNDTGIHKDKHIFSFEKTLNAQKLRDQNVLYCCSIFIAAGTCLTSRCFGTIGGLHIRTRRPMGGICEVRVEMSPVATTCKPSCRKTGSGIQNLIGGHTDRMEIA